MPALKSTRLRPAVSLGWVILRPGPTNRHNLRQIGIGRPFRLLKRMAARPAFVLRGVSPSTRPESQFAWKARSTPASAPRPNSGPSSAPC